MTLPAGSEKQGALFAKEAQTVDNVLPFNAPYVLENRRPRERRVRLLKLVGFVALGLLLKYQLLRKTTQEISHENEKHYGLVKPKGPMKIEDARKLFL